MAKEETFRTPIRVSESLFNNLSEQATTEYRDLAPQCHYLLAKFIEEYITNRPLDVSFPELRYKEMNKTPKTIILRLDKDIHEKIELLMNQSKQKKSALIRAVLKHQSGFEDLADLPRLF